MNKMYHKAVHLICLLTIFMLAGFILCLHGQSKHNNLLAPELISTLHTGLLAQARVNEATMQAIEKQATTYPFSSMKTSMQEAKNVLAQGSRILLLVDSLEQKPGEQLAKIVLEQASSYARSIYELGDYHQLISPDLDLLSKIDPRIFSIDYFSETRLQQHRHLSLSLIRSAVSLVTRSYLDYYSRKVGGPVCRFDVFSPSISIAQINPKVGEKIDIAVFLSTYSEWYTAMEYWLNGEKYTAKEGIGRFKTRFSEPGVHPIHFVVKVHGPGDSIRSSERTYYVRVRE